MCIFPKMCTVREHRPSISNSARKYAAHLTQEQGEQIWAQAKAQRMENERRERRELHEMLTKYHPWGRPGGGAPNPHGVRMHNLRFEEIVPRPEYSFPQSDWHPKPRNRSVQGGGGAPLMSNSGRIITTYREDPSLRFQFNSPMRDVVDKDLRYKVAPNAKTDYRKQLDALVAERKLRKEKENKRNMLHDKALGWSDPQTLQKYQMQRKQNMVEKENLQKVLPDVSNSPNNTSNAKADHQHHEIVHTCGKYGNNRSPNNGVELVPLLAKRRHKKIPLGTTDVTNYQNLADKKFREMGIKYLEDLRKQMSWKNKETKLKKQTEERECIEHYDTWNTFWGRPGHGAPVKADNRMMDLHALLYAVG